MGKTGRREPGDHVIHSIYFHVSLPVIRIYFEHVFYSDRSRHVVMTSSEDSGEVLPLTESAKCNLSAAEAYEYLTKAGNVYKKLTCLSLNPPV